MAVEGALQPDERVVIDGTDRLREGARVEVIAADPMQRAGANAPPGGGRRGPRGGPPGAASGAAPGAPGAFNRPAVPPAPSPLAAPGAQPASAAPGAAPGAAPEAAAAPAAAASGAGSAERPRWMDWVTPEQAEKLKAMSPEDRRAWLRAQREARGGGAPAP